MTRRQGKQSFISLARAKQLHKTELNYREAENIQTKVRGQYAEALDMAMTAVLGDLIQRRDTVVQATEAAYFAYRELLDAEIQELGYKRPEKGDYHIAIYREAMQSLKKKGIVFALPGPWAEKTEGKIDLLKLERVESDTNKAENKHGKITTPAVTINADGTTSVSAGTASKRSTTATYSRQYTSPGVSGMVRGIQNIDSVIIGEALVAADVLSLYDATQGLPSQVRQTAGIMNDTYYRLGMDYSMPQAIADLLSNLWNQLDDSQKAKVNALYQTQTHEGSKIKNKKDQAKLSVEKKLTGLTDLIASIEQEREQLRQELGNPKVNNVMIAEQTESDAVENPPETVQPEDTVTVEQGFPVKRSSDSVIGWLERILNERPDNISAAQWVAIQQINSWTDLIDFADSLTGSNKFDILERAILNVAMVQGQSRNGPKIIRNIHNRN